MQSLRIFTLPTNDNIAMIRIKIKYYQIELYETI